VLAQSDRNRAAAGISMVGIARDHAPVPHSEAPFKRPPCERSCSSGPVRNGPALEKFGRGRPFKFTPSLLRSFEAAALPEAISTILANTSAKKYSSMQRVKGKLSGLRTHAPYFSRFQPVITDDGLKYQALLLISLEPGIGIVNIGYLLFVPQL